MEILHAVRIVTRNFIPILQVKIKMWVSHYWSKWKTKGSFCSVKRLDQNVHLVFIWTCLRCAILVSLITLYFLCIPTLSHAKISLKNWTETFGLHWQTMFACFGNFSGSIKYFKVIDDNIEHYAPKAKQKAI